MVSKNITSHVNEFTCKSCKKQLATSSNGDLTKLTPALREINLVLEETYLRRLSRLKVRKLHSVVY